MDIAGFNQWLAERDLQGYWTLDRSSGGRSGPQAGFRPHLWKWADMVVALEQGRPDESLKDLEAAFAACRPGLHPDGAFAGRPLARAYREHLRKVAGPRARPASGAESGSRR